MRANIYTLDTSVKKKTVYFLYFILKWLNCSIKWLVKADQPKIVFSDILQVVHHKQTLFSIKITDPAGGNKELKVPQVWSVCV